MKKNPPSEFAAKFRQLMAMRLTKRELMIAKALIVNQNPKVSGKKSKNRRGWLWQLIEKQQGRCALCGQPFPKEWTPLERPTIDHILPLSKGGNNRVRNLQAAHYKCNNKRGDKDLHEFLMEVANA